jgi:hypothetical protein
VRIYNGFLSVPPPPLSLRSTYCTVQYSAVGIANRPLATASPLVRPSHGDRKGGDQDESRHFVQEGVGGSYTPSPAISQSVTSVFQLWSEAGDSSEFFNSIIMV